VVSILQLHMSPSQLGTRVRLHSPKVGRQDEIAAHSLKYLSHFIKYVGLSQLLHGVYAVWSTFGVEVGSLPCWWELSEINEVFKNSPFYYFRD
jgi:hypothetical protein